MPRAQVIDLASKRAAGNHAVAAERALVKAALAGGRDAFRQIVETHKLMLFKVAMGVMRDKGLAEDVVQETFIKAYSALDTFRSDARLGTWLHRIALLTAIDFQRRQHSTARWLDESLDIDEQQEPGDTNPLSRAESGVQSAQTRRQIDAAIAMLSPLEKSIFTLRHLQNLKLNEIALVVSRSEGTVKNILFRAIRKLRKQLTEAQELPVDMAEVKQW